MTSPSTVAAPSLPAAIPAGDRAYVFFSSESMQGDGDADGLCQSEGVASTNSRLGSGKIYRALRADYLQRPDLTTLSDASSVVLDLDDNVISPQWSNPLGTIDETFFSSQLFCKKQLFSLNLECIILVDILLISRHRH